jgi:hypothetical protein
MMGALLLLIFRSIKHEHALLYRYRCERVDRRPFPRPHSRFRGSRSRTALCHDGRARRRDAAKAMMSLDKTSASVAALEAQCGKNSGERAMARRSVKEMKQNISVLNPFVQLSI